MPAKKSSEKSETLKFLIIGDTVGKIARKALASALPELRKKHEIDFVIANCENLAHGAGASPKTIKEAQDAGVNFFTSGNHIWDKEDINDMLSAEEPVILRPANYPNDLPGRGDRVIEINGHKVLILNLIGRSSMKGPIDEPFRAAKALMEKYPADKFSAILVDFHAETTSEKRAMGFYFDGYASFLWGTHSHVATADLRLLPNGTAYVTDVGMTGPKDSVLGVNKEIIIHNFISPKKRPHDVVDNGTCEINAILITIKATDRKTVSVERIYQEVEV